MANQVSGLAGYNYYTLNDDGVTYTKDNDTPITDAAPYAYTSLDPATDYSGKLFWTSVDNDGNEDPTKHPFTVGTVATLDPTPDEVPMNSTDSAAIDAIMNTCLAAESAPGGKAQGATVAIVSPKGYKISSYGNGTASSNQFYRVASQTKTFTGTAVLMAVSAGRISLDDNLSKYLSGYQVDPTIQQMMMMQSGIYDYELAPGTLGLGLTTIGGQFTLNPTMAYTVDQVMALIRGGGGAPSVFAPGTAYYYTNSNHYVLAKILEATDPTQRSIDQIIQQDILTPLGMANTYFELGTGGVAAPASIGYAYGTVWAALGVYNYVDCSAQNTAFLWAAGAIVSQVSDMLLWGKELMTNSHGLISDDLHTLRMSTFAQQACVPAYGLNYGGPPTFGYGLAQIQVGSWYGHDGSWLGWDSCTMFHPETGTVVTVYENFQVTAPHVLPALSTMWYEIANYLYPGSPFYPGWGQTESGGIATTLPKVSTSLSGSQYVPAAITLPFTLPGTFEPVI